MKRKIIKVGNSLVMNFSADQVQTLGKRVRTHTVVRADPKMACIQSDLD